MGWNALDLPKQDGCSTHSATPVWPNGSVGQMMIHGGGSVSGRVSVSDCQWRVSVGECQWESVSGRVSVGECQWARVSG